MALRALMTAVVLALLLSATATAAKPRILATGDSMVEPVAASLKRTLAKHEQGRVRMDIQPASGISKPWRRNWLDYAPFQVRRHKPQATVMMLGANEGFGMLDERGREVRCCRRSWLNAYAEAVGRMIDTYTRKGRRVYWLNLPMPGDDGRFKVFAAVNAALEQAARRHDRVRILDMAKRFTPGYRYRRSMRVNGERVVVREPDQIHLNRRGGQIAARVVRRALIRDDVIGAGR